ncbi:MAG: VWA domain-containing protein [Myxococcota bacterium]
MDRQLFSTNHRLPPADAINEAGGAAYAFSPAQALAQYASTGCLSATFYSSAADQLAEVLRLLDLVPPAYVAKTALWARERGHMKDLPALLVAYLTVADAALADQVFDRVIDDAKMLRNFVQVIRSGVIGRRSLGSVPKRLVRRWLAARTPEQLFKSSIGDRPSLGDVIKLAHPRPENEERSAMYAYLSGRPFAVKALPALAQEYEAWKLRPEGEPPAVPSALLTSLELNRQAWVAMARRASWQETRMNLGSFARHGVFAQARNAELVAKKLRDREAIKRARVMPYQLLMAHMAARSVVPPVVRAALEAALEIALENVPALKGKIYVCTDVSGSMQAPVTGHRKGATTAVRCIDVAGLISAAMLSMNDAEVLPFDTRVVPLSIKKGQSVLANAAKLASVGGGGTACSAPLAELNARKAKGALVLLVSDNESWVDGRAGGTALMAEWELFAARNRGAKLVCLDLAPNRSSPALERADVLNIGGFSDAVFGLIQDFAADRSGQHWVEKIESMVI